MSFGGSSQPQPAVTTQIQKTELPAWVQAAGQENYEAAKAMPTAQGYVAPRVAPLSGMEAAAPGFLSDGYSRGATGFDTAAYTAAQGAGHTMERVGMPGGVATVDNGGGFLGRDIARYMDPNIENVVNATMSQMERTQAQGTQSLTDKARAMGALRGSRAGVENAVYQAEQERNQGQVAAGLRSQAFESAAGRAGMDVQTALQAALANQQSGLTTQGQQLQAGIANQNAWNTAGQLRLQAGDLAARTGTAATTAGNQSAVVGAGLGATARGIDQASMDADYGEFLRMQQAPTDALNLRAGMLSATPYNKTTSGTTSATAAPQQSNNLLSTLGAVGTIGSMFFSDKKVKKNIKLMGKVPGSDLNKYEFEYKPGALPGAPRGKQIGLLAQDVERKVPGAVQPILMGGKKVKAVDYDMAMAGAPRIKGAGLPRDPRDDKGVKRRPYKPRVGVSAHLGL